MSDLISRSALIELIQKDIEKTASFMNTAEKYDGSFEKLYGQLNALKNYKSIISDMPTAYDISKVVAELEEAKGEIALNEDDLNIYCGALDDAIDIVRRGGVE